MSCPNPGIQLLAGGGDLDRKLFAAGVYEWMGFVRATEFR